MKAVIMCGGLGTRLKPLTESQPKPMLKLLNRPVIDIVIEKLIDSGIKEIYVSLGYMADELTEYCEGRKYNADIVFREEKRPLGTAGGVKNCIPDTDDDILVVSGDNVFDFDIEKISNFHYASDADVTVCGITVNDPREYGVIIKDDDCSISAFVEKPTWEQAQSFLANTGIYLIKGEVLDMIPSDSFYDFADDLFPLLFRSEKRFMCCHLDGFWGDMGEFPAYLQVTRDILDGRFRNFNFRGSLFNEDAILENDVQIKAPCLLGRNITLGGSCVIGPYCVIGDNSSVDKNCIITDSIIGEDCSISENSEIKGSVVSDFVRIADNCLIDENTVLGYASIIGRFSHILKNCKIWPGRRIYKESVVSKDMHYETPSKIDFDIFGLSGRVDSQITAADAVELGQAIASCTSNIKAGISCDGKKCSENYKNLVFSGIRTCGGIIYDFGESAKIQSYFYSAYCNLDIYIYISLNGDIVSFSFFGKNGMPVNGKTARKINNNYKFSAYNYCTPEKYQDVFNMHLFPTVYKTYFNKLLGENPLLYNVNVECDNPFLKSFLSSVFSERKTASAERSVQLLVNYDGTEIYLAENDRFYSTERILLLLCELAFAGNKDVIIPEEAPSIIEEKARIYKRNAIRQYVGSKSGLVYPNDVILDNIWCFDPLLMCAKLFGIISESRERLEQLFEFQNDFALRKSIFEYSDTPSEIRKMIEASGAEKYDDTHYIINSRKGRARIRQLGNSARIRVLAEASDMETAKELSVFVAEKIKSGDIDKVY